MRGGENPSSLLPFLSLYRLSAIPPEKKKVTKKIKEKEKKKGRHAAIPGRKLVIPLP